MNLIEELMEYTGETKPAVLSKMWTSCADMQTAWEKHIDNFYQNNKIYLYDLTRFNGEKIYKKRLKAHNFKGMKILDFGGGIGTASIHYAKDNIVHYCDVKNSPVWKYAKWRFKKHKVNVKMLDAKEYKNFDNDYDVVLFFDVIEHLVRWKEVVYFMTQKSKNFVINFPAQSYVTCHLTDGKTIKEFIKKFGQFNENA